MSTLYNKMMETLERDARAKKNEQKVQAKPTAGERDMSPYTSNAINLKFRGIYGKLESAREKYGSDADAYRDAMRLTDEYGQTVQASFALLQGDKSRDYLSIAEKTLQDSLNKTVWGYQYQGGTAEALEKALAGTGYRSPEQINAGNRQNVIDAAKQRGLSAGLTPEEEERARMLEEAVRYSGGTGRIINGLSGTQEAQLTDTGADAVNPFRLSPGAREQYRQEATALREKGVLTYEAADQYMQGMPGYSFAKAHPGNLTGYAGAAQNIADVLKKISDGGWDALTETEKEAALQVFGATDTGLDAYSWPEMSREQAQDAVGSLTAEDWEQLRNAGGQWAEGIARYDGMFSAYAPTDEQQAILEYYRQTPEGARAYLAEARGTKDEDKARDNLYFVERKDRYDRIKAREDFSDDSQPREQFTSGDAELDRLYKIINNIGGERDKAELYQAMSGGQDAALDFAHNLEPDDIGVFNVLMHAHKEKEARDFLEYARYGVNEKIRARTEEAAAGLANSGPLGAAAAGVLSTAAGITRPIGAVDTYAQILRNLFAGEQGYRPVDMNTGAQMPAALAEAANKSIQEQVDWTVNIFGRQYDLFDMLYGTTQSGIESWTIGMVSGGMSALLGMGNKGATAIASILMGGGAAQNTMQEIASREGNNAQIALGGTLAGIFEAAFEEISFGALFKDLDDLTYRPFKERLKNIGREAFVNFTEETNTEIADIIMEYMVMGDGSEQKQQYEEYRRLGMEPEEAARYLWRDMIDRAVEAGLSGALMGAAFGEAANINANMNAKQIEQYKAELKKLQDEQKQQIREDLTKATEQAVGADRAEAAADAMIARAEGKDLTEEQAALLQELDDMADAAEAAESEEAQANEEAGAAFGAQEAFNMGVSGRSREELEGILADRGMELTGDILRAYDRGRAELAADETNRINQVKEWNAGPDGSRVGVVRSIKAEEAEKAGVAMVSGEYTQKTRRAIEALRGFAEMTGVNMVLFESPVKEGERQGANGWYDRDNRRVYLDIYSGKGNEQAMLRTAAHEMTHFIQDWSPAQYGRLRDFLIDYYYSQDKNAIKKLIQEQRDKDSTLSEPDAMDEVIADASEMMLDGDEDAVRALADKHPGLFGRIRGWIDRWTKALVRAWRGTEPGSQASRLLRDVSDKFKEAQRIWWEALEDASIAHRGEIREAEIEAEQAAKRKSIEERKKELLERQKKRRQEALDRANSAQTAEEGQEAIQEAQAAQRASESLETQIKQEQAQADQEAKRKKAEAAKIKKAGQGIEIRLNRLGGEAREYVVAFAQENGIAMDGTAEAGSALMKEALHYWNQGKAGLAFNPNTEAGKGAYAEFARKMNEYGQAARREETLAAMAEEAAADEQKLPEAEQKPATDEQMLPEGEQKPATDEQMLPEAEQEAATEAEAKEESSSNLFSRESLEEMAQENQADKERIFGRDQEKADNEPTKADNEPTETDSTPKLREIVIDLTPKEEKALETQAQTVRKIDDVLQGMTKKARNLVMKWAANEHINTRMEDGNIRAVRFAQFAKAWYDAGKESMPVTAVTYDPQWADEDFPPFLEDEFYRQGKADAAAAEKAKQRKGKKANEKPADKGTGEPVGRDGDGAERLLEEVPAQDVQENGGGRDAVRPAEIAERPDAGNDGGSDGSGTSGIRGAGVRERSDVRPGAGGITEAEAEPEAEPETPEGEQARATEEALEEQVEETETYLEAETPRGTNFVIGESLGLAKNTSEKERYAANVAAIRLMKKLEAENRYATPEEQEILSKYVGWGGLSGVFPDQFGQVAPKWKKEYAELADLLTPEEYEAAKDSTQNAHYTSIEVIRAMYEGLRHLGFQGGRMLEPSGGIGHFIGAMPADMQQQVKSWTMVELDSITGRIAKKLYPLADVRVQGFQDAKIADNLMDVAIGNVPFGEVPIYDKAYPEYLRKRIHNYFFVKAIDKVRPGGLLMFITSHGTMDAQDSSMRGYMMGKADLLGAVRLPWTAFKGNANTEVVTDILIFKKRKEDTAYNGQDFRWATSTPIDGSRFYVNDYFLHHPEMVLGTQTNTGTMRGLNNYNVEPKGKDLGAQIRAAIETIKAAMDYTAERPTVEQIQRRTEEAQKTTKENGFEIKGGKVYQNRNGHLEEVKRTKTEKGKEVEAALTEEEVRRITDMLSMRDTARELQNMQKRGADPKEIAKQREKLNQEYDSFSKKYEYTIKSGNNKGKVIPGMLHDRKNAKLIEKDPDNYFILSLEQYDKKANTAKKADIFSHDTIAPAVTVTHVETPLEAMNVTLNEKGYIDLARAAELLGESQEQAQKEMLDSGAAFLTGKGTLESRTVYLSGDVRAKLREAEKLATVDARYERNVEELKKVIPKDVQPEDISVKPGMTWIPNEIYERFICETIGEFNYGSRKNVAVTFNPFTGEYSIDFSKSARTAYLNTGEWGAGGKSFQWIIDKIMNSRSLKVTYTDSEKRTHTDEDATSAVEDKAEKIQAHFTKWLWKDSTRAEMLSKLYNDQYNAIVNPEYSGDGLTVPGLNANFTLRPHQASVIQRGVQQGGNLLIAHCVGAGKTLEMASIAMKLKQLGIIRKPVFAAPNYLVGQWGREFLKFYPAAKILVLDEKSFTPQNKREFLNRIATGDYDAVIMSYEQFKGMPMTPEYEREYRQMLLDQAIEAMEEARRGAGKKAYSVKELQKYIDTQKVKLKEMTDLKRDEAEIYFEDTGIDGIFLDEAQNHKNLFFTTQMQNVSGVGNGKGSDRANDMYMKVRWLRELNGGRGIVFATGTPVMNTMGEMYLMQKYLQEDKLEQIGIRSFDAWAKMFGKVVDSSEPDATGERKKKQVFAEFNNLPELQRLFRNFTDVKTTLDDVKDVKIPTMKTGKRIIVMGEMSERQKLYQKELKELAQTIKGRRRQKGEESFLTITTKGRKAAYSQRMIDPSLPYADGDKIVMAADNVFKIWQESADTLGTQLIFCDMGVPKDGSDKKNAKGKGKAEQTAFAEEEEEQESEEAINFYQDIKNMLVGKGVPAEQIAFIHDYKTQEAKNALFDEVNDGKVRVLIGSTGKMSTGMNAQRRIVALHHLDAPWRPGDLTQREGRALRQGNINDEVGVYVYVTKGSFDEVMWGKLARKARIVNNVMNGTNDLRTVEGEGDDSLSFQEIMAASSENPLIQEQFNVQDKIRKLEGIKRQHSRAQKDARDIANIHRAYIENAQVLLPKAEADAETAKKALDAPFMMKVDGKRYTERAKAAGPLLEIAQKYFQTKAEKKMAEFGGLTISMGKNGRIEIRGQSVHEVDANFESATGNMQRIMNKISDLTTGPEVMRAEIERRTQEMESAEKKMQEPFEKEDELRKLYKREAEIEKILNPPDQRVPMAEGEEQEQTEKKGVKYSRRNDVRRIWEKAASMVYTTNETGTIEMMEEWRNEEGELFTQKTGEIAIPENKNNEKVEAYMLPDTRKTFDAHEITMPQILSHGRIAIPYYLAREDFRYKVTQMLENEIAILAGIRQEGVYWRAASSAKERELIEKGRIRESVNHMTNEKEGGLSVWERPKYFGYLIRVTGDVITMGSDGEPVLDINTVKLLEDINDLRSKEEEGKSAFIEKYGWTRTQLENGLAGKYDLPKYPNIKSSQRDPDALSDRELLAQAYEGIASTDYERKALERYKGLIAQLDADTEELKRLKREIHDKTFVKGQVDTLGAYKARQAADELAKKIAKADKTLLNMQKSAALKAVLEVEKREAAKKEGKKAQEQLARYNEGVAKREYAMRIKKISERLGKWLTQPNKDQHVPKAMQKSVALLLQSIQQDIGAKFTGEGGARRERNFLRAMQQMQEIVNDISSYQLDDAENRVSRDYRLYYDLPDGFTEQLAALVKSVEDQAKANAGRALDVNAMSSKQMEELYKVLSTISSTITKANSLIANSAFAHVDEAALNTIRYIRDQGKVVFMRDGRAHNFLNWENMQPIWAFERFGEGGRAIFDGLRQGQATMAQLVHQILLLSNEEYAEKHGGKAIYTAQESKDWGQETRTFTVNDKEVVMTVADVMSLYCLLKRGQAIGHIFGEGFRVADFRDKRGRLIPGSGTEITEDEARQIVGTLTNRQIQVADAIQTAMTRLGAYWENYVSMKRWGYKLATEKNYFPIEVDNLHLLAKTDKSKGNELYRLLNISSVKPITEGARNRIMVKDIFEVFSSHMTDAAQYRAFALPLLDAIKWINYHVAAEVDGKMKWQDSIREAAREMYGGQSARYIIEMLKDVSGTQATGDTGETMALRHLQRFNRQAVGANVSVALKQPLSIVRAAMELGSMDLIKGVIGQKGWYKQNAEEMLRYSGIARWKDLGFYDVNVSRPVKRLALNRETAVDKVLDKATALAEGADKLTWAALWGASKNWVNKHGGTYASTEDYYKAVTKKFEDVIYKTQVVDSILTRSQFMRGTGFVSKMLSSFMSEPTTTYNMLLHAWEQMRNDMRRGMDFGHALMQHRGILIRTTAVYMVSSALMTLLNAAIGAWRDDDDYETFMEKFQAGLLDSAIDEFLPFNLLPIVSDIYDFAKKFAGDYLLPKDWNITSFAGGDSPIYGAYETALQAAGVWDKVLGENRSHYTLYGAIYKTMNALSQGAGIPIAPAMREVVALWNNTVAMNIPEMRLETYESTVSQGAKALYKAMKEGDSNREALVRRQLAANGEIQKDIDSAVKSLIKADMNAKRITEEDAVSYLNKMVNMDRNDAYFETQKWDFKAQQENKDEEYSRYDVLREAIRTGQGIQEAYRELIDHGVKQDTVQATVRATITNLTAKEKTMTPARAENLLKQYGGYDANQAWIRAQELTYQARTGKETSSDIAMVNLAIEQRTSPAAAIDGLLKHGKEAKDISSALTSKWKETYLDLRSTNVQEAARLKGQLISIYDYLGYDGKKKVEDWEKAK